MSVNVEGNVKQAGTGNAVYQNLKADGARESEKNVPKPKADDAACISISREGIEKYRARLRENGAAGPGRKIKSKAEKDFIIKMARQATNSLSANDYYNRLAGEIHRLKNQSDTGGMGNPADKKEYRLKAYGNLHNEIVQGYRDGTRERYVEDRNSDTGFRKMTLEEELSSLEQAYKRMMGEADKEDMISNEFKRLYSKSVKK